MKQCKVRATPNQQHSDYCVGGGGGGGGGEGVAETKLKQARFRACLHGSGGLQVGEITPLGGVTRLFI